MAFWTLEQLNADGGLVPERLARRLSCQPIFGIGSSVREFVHRFTEEKEPWQSAGMPSAGNGALMRIAPVLLPHLRDGSPNLWADAAIAAMITHNDRSSTAACLAFVSMLWSLLAMSRTPDPEWWVDEFVRLAMPLEGESRLKPRFGRHVGRYEGPLSRFVQEVVTEALSANHSAVDACAEWGSGAYLLETMPSILYILARWADSPRDALIRAVNDTKDNDTIACIVGAAVGALHGKEALPEEWVEGLLGRTAESDDGRVFELITEARALWWDRFDSSFAAH
jgi:ADP-ribosylglycohydrolase